MSATTQSSPLAGETDTADLNDRLAKIMDALDGLSYRQIETILANVNSSIKCQGVFRLDRSRALELRDIKPPSRGS